MKTAIGRERLGNQLPATTTHIPTTTIAAPSADPERVKKQRKNTKRKAARIRKQEREQQENHEREAAAGAIQAAWRRRAARGRWLLAHTVQTRAKVGVTEVGIARKEYIEAASTKRSERNSDAQNPRRALCAEAVIRLESEKAAAVVVMPGNLMATVHDGGEMHEPPPSGEGSAHPGDVEEVGRAATVTGGGEPVPNTPKDKLRRLKNADKKKKARQRKKELEASSASLQNFSALRDAKFTARCQAYADIVIEAAAAWHRRRAEIERNVADAREEQRAQELRRERAAAAVQAAWKKAAARRRHLGPYDRRVAQIDGATTEGQVQREEHVWAALCDETPAVDACRRGGERDWREQALRAVVPASSAYAEAGRASETRKQQRHEVAEEPEAGGETMRTETSIMLATTAEEQQSTAGATAKKDERAVGADAAVRSPLRDDPAKGTPPADVPVNLVQRRQEQRAAEGMVEEAGVEAAGSFREAAAVLTAQVAATEKQEREEQESASCEKEQREKLEELLLAKVKQVLKERQEANISAEQQAAEESVGREEARLANIRSSLQLPPARKHANIGTIPDCGKSTSTNGRGWGGLGARPSPTEPPSPEETNTLSRRPRDSYTPYPLQLVEGKLLLFDPGEFDLWPLMAQLRGWSLELGAAPVWGGGNVREAEAFAVACGFSAALGPIVLEVVTTAVYGKVFANGVSVLTTDHVVYAFGRYWETAIAPCVDVTERFFRLAKMGGGGGDGGAGGVRKEDMRQFVVAVALLHPDLDFLSPDDRSLYADTVLGILFHKFSRCGLIGLADLRSSGFVAQMNAVGRLEMDLEDSQFFSVGRQQTMRSEYLSLCGADGWSVGLKALSEYRRGGFEAVGNLRASRIIDAGQHPPSTSSSAGDGAGGGGAGGRMQQLGYDAWVSFWLCEEALRTGYCSRQDVRYCFALLDRTGRGRVGIAEMRPFFEGAAFTGSSEDDLPDIEVAFTHFQDSIGVDRERDHVTLEEMSKPTNVERSGQFFGFLFLAIDFGCGIGDDDDNICNGYNGTECRPESNTVTDGGSGSDCAHAKDHDLPVLPSSLFCSFSSSSSSSSCSSCSSSSSLLSPAATSSARKFLPIPPRQPSVPPSSSTATAPEAAPAALLLKPASSLPPTPPLTPPARTPPSTSPLSPFAPAWTWPPSPTSAASPQRRQQHRRWGEGQGSRSGELGLENECGRSLEFYHPETDPDFEAELASIVCADSDRGDIWRIK